MFERRQKKSLILNFYWQRLALHFVITYKRECQQFFRLLVQGSPRVASVPAEVGSHPTEVQAGRVLDEVLDDLTVGLENVLQHRGRDRICDFTSGTNVIKPI